MAGQHPIFRLRRSAAGLVSLAPHPFAGKDRQPAAGLMSGLFFALELATLYWSMQFTSASRQMVLLYIAPFVLAALPPRFMPSESLRRWQWGAMSPSTPVVLKIGQN